MAAGGGAPSTSAAGSKKKTKKARERKVLIFFFVPQAAVLRANLTALKAQIAKKNYEFATAAFERGNCSQVPEYLNRA